jgi:hypothetical protein
MPVLMVGVKYSPKVIVHLGYMFVLTGFSYVMSLLLAKLTVSELKQKSEHMSPKTKALQAQLTR